eukprot:TRINITY_DN13541_c0_g1_i1.p1 TRINITY_DN13541_c0_g1~~TRINITY_DN13541_c0_g1_i1.p1  ORF type:complete len:463 (+),score=117.46 TRINITY_DN13541_c0_g1_i1:181-1569(+)
MAPKGQGKEKDENGTIGEEGGQEVKYNAQGKVKGKHDKPKPWDTDDINHWKIEPFDPAWNEGGLLEESSFATLFPQYREKYLREVWPSVTRALKEHGIDCQLNLVEGSMTVSTTRKTRDPFIIMKARDLIKLLSRSVPATQALKILDDAMQCDIIKIGNMVRNKERFVKRRQRLIGPNSSTLKALELLTQCYMLVQGNSVACMGPWKGLKVLRRIVEDCIRNVHPIYHIKALMIKRELARDPQLANENWERFLPKFKKRNVKTKKPANEREKKTYTPFPPPQQPSKVDLALESGEYFLSEEKKKSAKWEAKTEQQQQRTEDRKREREQAFVPPKEAKGGKQRKGPAAAAEQPSAGSDGKVSKEAVASMAESLKKRAMANLAGRVQDEHGVEAYLAVPPSGKRKPVAPSSATSEGKQGKTTPAAVGIKSTEQSERKVQKTRKGAQGVQPLEKNEKKRRKEGQE